MGTEETETSTEDIQNFDVDEYLARTLKDNQLAAAQPHTMGPVAATAERYDSETLNYLLENITDSFYEFIHKSIHEARLSNDGKRRLLLIANEFTDKEIVVALIKDYSDVKAQLNNFREVAKYSKLCMRRIDATTEFFIILSVIETHYKLKLSRSWKGFERVEQQTQRIKSDTSSSYADKTDRGEATGLRRLAINLHGGGN